MFFVIFKMVHHDKRAGWSNMSQFNGGIPNSNLRISYRINNTPV